MLFQKCILGHFYHRFEGMGLSDSEIGKDLAVKGHVCQLLPVDKVAVLEAVFASASIDPLNPQRSHVALQDLPVGILLSTHASINTALNRKPRVRHV